MDGAVGDADAMDGAVDDAFAIAEVIVGHAINVDVSNQPKVMLESGSENHDKNLMCETSDNLENVHSAPQISVNNEENQCTEFILPSNEDPECFQEGFKDKKESPKYSTTDSTCEIPLINNHLIQSLSLDDVHKQEVELIQYNQETMSSIEYVYGNDNAPNYMSNSFNVDEAESLEGNHASDSLNYETEILGEGTNTTIPLENISVQIETSAMDFDLEIPEVVLGQSSREDYHAHESPCTLQPLKSDEEILKEFNVLPCRILLSQRDISKEILKFNKRKCIVKLTRLNKRLLNHHTKNVNKNFKYRLGIDVKKKINVRDYVQNAIRVLDENWSEMKLRRKEMILKKGAEIKRMKKFYYSKGEYVLVNDVDARKLGEKTCKVVLNVFPNPNSTAKISGSINKKKISKSTPKLFYLKDQFVYCEKKDIQKYKNAVKNLGRCRVVLKKLPERV